LGTRRSYTVFPILPQPMANGHLKFKIIAAPTGLVSAHQGIKQARLKMGFNKVSHALKHRVKRRHRAV